MTMILHVCKLYRIYPAFIVENKPPIVKLWRTQSMRADKRRVLTEQVHPFGKLGNFFDFTSYSSSTCSRQRELIPFQ